MLYYVNSPYYRQFLSFATGNKKKSIFPWKFFLKKINFIDIILKKKIKKKIEFSVEIIKEGDNKSFP